MVYGAGAPANAQQFTAMLTNDDMPLLYYLRLAGKAVRIPPAVFNKTAATMIDLGTHHHLPPGHRLRRAGWAGTGGLSFLDTCYNFTGRSPR